MDFFIDIGIAVILRLLKSGRIPKAYLAGLLKVRDALNIALPVELNGKAAPGINIV